MREKAVISDATNLASAKAEGRVDATCQYFEVRLGAESQSLQDTVRAITDLDVLSQLVSRIFIVNRLDEAKSLILASLVSQ